MSTPRQPAQEAHTRLTRNLLITTQYTMSVSPPSEHMFKFKFIYSQHIYIQIHINDKFVEYIALIIK